MLQELTDATNVVIHSKEEEKLIKEWETHDQNGKVKVDALLANALGNEMHDLEENLKKLKELFA